MAKRNKGKKRLRLNWATWIWLLLVVILVLLASRYVDATGNSSQSATAAELDALESVSLPDGTASTLCVYTGYKSYFNPTLHIPNCVVYELTGDETEGTEKRYNTFLTDENVEGCPTTDDYKYSGYDRGHMAPAGDMKWSEEAMRESFYLTNICPQVKALNTGQWNNLEGQVRQWAKRDSSLIVVTGPIVGDNPSTIGDSKVAVPDGFFKVILAHRANPPRAIGFIYSNEKPTGKIANHAVSVDDVEALTGIDFFAALPDDVEAQVESQCDFKQWNYRAK